MTDHHRGLHPSLAPINDSMLSRESWKIFQIMAEFAEGFERLAQIKPSVSIFGSARTPKTIRIINQPKKLPENYLMRALVLSLG